ncbi:MAG: aminotransferase class IV [Verrucomicrobia bacterium]|nr:aminotransferase class IV [Verrucomicrobiota bacterium]
MIQLWCNGQWLEVRDFTASPTDRGLTLGLGLFETLLALDGAPVFAERHLARLRNACERLGWQPELPDLREIMVQLLHRNDLTTGRAKIRLAITGGSGPLDDLTLGADHRVWMTAMPLAVPSPATTANLSPWVRNERSPLAGLKCAAYAENLIALEHAARLGFEETVFLNTAGRLCEAATSNIFVVKNGGLLTPSPASGCLPGITREVVLELADRLRIPCQACDLTTSDLHAADELFLTSSIRGPIEVSRFEERTFPPGKITHALREAWTAATGF